MARGESYEHFVNKFKPKKTTDDCYTPPEVYRVVRDWAIDRYDLTGRDIVRPFYPGGDYENYNYMYGDVVIDNPPFSILSGIVRFYIDRDIDFFLFAPRMTVMGCAHIDGANIVVIGDRIVYENGATIPTSFVTNMGEFKACTAPDLDAALRVAKRKKKNEKYNKPKHKYPPNVLMAHHMVSWSSRGIDYAIRSDQCCAIRRLDSQKPFGKAIYGSGLLLSESAAAERAAAEEWTLSERENDIIRKLR